MCPTMEFLSQCQDKRIKVTKPTLFNMCSELSFSGNPTSFAVSLKD